MSAQQSHSIARRAIALAMAGALTATPFIYPVAAYADTADTLQQQLVIAEESLYALQEAFGQAEADLGKVNYELEETRAAIETLNTQIAENRDKLSHKQEGLAAQVSDSYKHGTSTMLEVVLGSTDFDDFVSRLFYVERINEQYATSIREVNELRDALETEEAELKQHEADLETLAADAEQKMNAMNTAAQEQQRYINELSDELKVALEEKRQREAEAARAAAEAAAAEEARKAAEAEAQAQAQAQAQQQQQQQQQTTDTQQAQPTQDTQQTAPTQQTVSAPTQQESTSTQTQTTPVEQTTYEEDTTPTVTTPTVTAPTTPTVSYTAPSTASVDQRTAAVNAALSQVGCAYIWGEQLPGQGFDCNGLTNWAWAQAGVEIPYTSGTYSYGQFQWLKASGRWVYNVEDLKLGDLVFYSHDGGSTCFHVAMYVGGGMVVHAIDYAHGIQVTEYDWCSGFCGGGSPI